MITTAMWYPKDLQAFALSLLRTEQVLSARLAKVNSGTGLRAAKAAQSEAVVLFRSVAEGPPIASAVVEQLQ